jgi:hypothetical protein
MGQYQAYPYIANEAIGHFKFQSVGKRGTIDKVIELAQLAPDQYNLALLDFDPVTQDYVDNSITDNGDMPEVLATVMAVILDHLSQFPRSSIVITGNGVSRTRLYQIAINKVWDDLRHQLKIFGYQHSGWQAFEPNQSYESFLIARNLLDYLKQPVREMKVLEKKLDIPANLRPSKTIDNTLPDLSEHPVVKAKTERARKFLEESPIPEHLLRRK